MLQSSIEQLKKIYGSCLNVNLMSVYPSEDRVQCPHDFVKIIPAQPQRLLFAAFPCAVFYRMFSWCPPVKALLLKNKILGAYHETDLVVDEAGISFSDSRGWILNTYAFVCMAVPMLLGVPVVKYSQAFGPFRNAYNRLLAKWILPKAEVVIARGDYSYRHLHEAGIRQNTALYADGAFTMPPAPLTEKRVQQVCRQAGYSNMAALSISSVVEGKCRKAGIDYCGIMAAFAAYLAKEGYQVYMFANAARINSKKPRNNDLMTGDKIFALYQKRRQEQNQIPGENEDWDTDKDTDKDIDKDIEKHKEKNNKHIEKHRNKEQDQMTEISGSLVWEHREMDAEEIRAYIGQCEFLIASRFHAMVFALSKQVPVMLIGWSHKYEEVLRFFGLRQYAADYSQLNLEGLKQNFSVFLHDQEKIRGKIQNSLPYVLQSSERNVKRISSILDGIMLRAESRFLNHVIDLNNPDAYMGTHLSCCMGYALDDEIRKNAASGGMVTALLCSLLKNHDIDGAWVVKTAFTKEGALTYETYVAVTPEQIREASSSVYMEIPMLSHLEQLRQFDGKIAVVLTPCMMQAFCKVLEKDETLRAKIVLKIGLFCSGAHDKKATEYALDKCRVPRDGAKRLYYRRGHWRGISSVVYHDGTQKDFSYTKSVCAYKNAFFFAKRSCLCCKDQFAAAADVSFGDVWLPEVKKDPVKYTGCVIRSEKAQDMIRRAVKQGDLSISHMPAARMLRSQKRALTMKYRKNRWNHRLAGYFAEKNRKFSVRHPDLLKKIPVKWIYYYMCLIRLLLSW